MEQRDWNKIVLESDNTRFFVPSELEKEAKNCKKEAEAIDKELAKIAKADLLRLQMQEAFFLKMREWLDKNGFGESIWMKGLGFDETALKDGKLVINIYDKK